jgi:hypothetical protein
MKVHSLIIRCTAFFLMLVFSQKTGAGLLFHNLLHTNKAVNHIPSQQNDSSKEIGYTCSCIDDFLTPFVEADKLIVSPVGTTLITVNEFLPATIRFYTHVFSSLRGPPSDQFI